MKVDLLLMKNILMLLPQIAVILSRSMTAASETDLPIQKKIYGSGMTTVVIRNK